jgi:hypothetical protein
MIAILIILQVKFDKHHQKLVQSNLIRKKIQKFDICTDRGITYQEECNEIKAGCSEAADESNCGSLLDECAAAKDYEIGEGSKCMAFEDNCPKSTFCQGKCFNQFKLIKSGESSDSGYDGLKEACSPGWGFQSLTVNIIILIISFGTSLWYL